MSGFVGNFVTPITMSQQFGFGEAWGSGTYIRGKDAIWILTAAHVITDVPSDGKLAHLPVSGGDYNAALGNPQLKKYPVDAGAIPISPHPQFLPPVNRIVMPASISPRYRAVHEELLFWRGFPGYRSGRNDPLLKKDLITSAFAQLDMRSLPMLSQRIPNDEVRHIAFDPEYHLGIHYPDTGTRALDHEQVALPNAKGMSGSAVWDTKFVWAMENNVSWRPQMAEICGVVWASPNQEIVLATKIEHVRAVLPEVFV